jgi:hydrogenase maturation factor
MSKPCCSDSQKAFGEVVVSEVRINPVHVGFAIEKLDKAPGWY